MALPVKMFNESLEGLYFHSFHSHGGRNWQGKVVKWINNYKYQVQLFSWLTGEETNLEYVSFEDMKNWLFYNDYETWLNEGEQSYDSAHIIKMGELVINL